jgi:peptide/nickel transport system substrate-binding protein
MKRLALGASLLALLGLAWAGSGTVRDRATEPGARTAVRRGGRLVATLRSEPKTFNPLLAANDAAREVIQAMTADLVHVNRQTQLTEPALAEWWRVSPDGRAYTIGLRKGVLFSDGQPFDADDVVFTFQAYLDPQLHSPVRDHLIVGGQPVAVRKVDAHTVRLELAEPYGAGERILDSVAMLPEHVLGPAHRAGRLASAWTLSTPPAELVGLGPFRLKEYEPGERVRLERNPHYWKRDPTGRPLPYLDELVFLTVPSEDAQVLRFQSGESQLLARVSADRHDALRSAEGAGRYRLLDLGAGLEYSALVFNLNRLGAPSSAEFRRKQSWFRDVRFRRAISLAVDRLAIARLAYGGRATPVVSHVTPGNRLWMDASLAPPAHDPAAARRLLAEAGFRPGAGELFDLEGRPVQFSILTSAGNVPRTRMAALIQEDLRAIGIQVRVVPSEFRAMTERLLRARDYEAALLSLGGGDGDPGSEMNLWLSTGSLHLWDLGQSGPGTPWEAEIDALMQAQMTATDQAHRRRLYHRVQRLVAEHLPMIFLASPNVLVGVDVRLTGVRPGILEPQLLWNVEEIGFAGTGS